VRSLLPRLGVVLIAAFVGCERVTPGPTVYVTVPAAQSVPTPPPREPTPPASAATPAKPTEPAKSTDPWEEAKAYFKKIEETEASVTKQKLDALDFQSALVCRQYMQFRIDIHADRGMTAGQLLLSKGLDEFVLSKASRFLADADFWKIMDKFNPKPTRDEIISGVIEFAVTNSVVRDANVKMIIKNGVDRRTSKELNSLVSRWSGK
jgi:hypothetical protein